MELKRRGKNFDSILSFIVALLCHSHCSFDVSVRTTIFLCCSIFFFFSLPKRWLIFWWPNCFFKFLNFDLNFHLRKNDIITSQNVLSLVRSIALSFSLSPSDSFVLLSSSIHTLAVCVCAHNNNNNIKKTHSFGYTYSKNNLSAFAAVLALCKTYGEFHLLCVYF